MSSDSPWAMQGGVAELTEAIVEEALELTTSADAALNQIVMTLEKLNPDRAVEALGAMVAYMLLELAEPNQEHLLADAFCHALHQAIHNQKNKHGKELE